MDVTELDSVQGTHDIGDGYSMDFAMSELLQDSTSQIAFVSGLLFCSREQSLVV